MKQIKKLLTLVTFVLALGIMLSVTTDAEAAVSKRAAGAVYVNPQTDGYGDVVWKSFNKKRIDQNGTGSFSVYFGREGDYISDVKVNKKGLVAGVTYQYNSYYPTDATAIGNYKGAYGTISLSASKAGTYTVSFNVRKADGSVAGAYKVKVYAYKYLDKDGWLTPYKQAKLGSKVVYSDTAKRKGTTFTNTYKSTNKVANSLKSAKLKFTANKGYKITGFVYVYTNANGKPVAKAVKNGRTIKLSQQYAERNYASNGEYTKTNRMYTNVYVSYKDTYLGTYVKYSVVKRNNQKMIKCTSKDTTGQVTSSYTYLGTYSNRGDINFWRY